MGVFKLSKKKIPEVEIEDIWDCTMCRECIRNEKFDKKINLGKKRQHYRFNIESVGVIEPQELLLTAFKILNEKNDHYIKYFKSLS